ncbi:FAD-binding protein, partial [bacterium]
MNQKNTSRHDAIVIGAGLAGGLAAIELARARKNVLLIEREAAAH